MKIDISTTEAARNLGDCLARIRHTGDSFILHKNNVPIAELRPLAPARRATLREIMTAWRSLPSDPGFADDLAKVNAADQILTNPWDS